MRRRRYLLLSATAVATVAAGCSNGGAGEDGSGEGLDNGIVIERIRGVLEEEGVQIHELRDGGNVVTLEYAPGKLPDDAGESEIETRVEETIRSVSQEYYQPIVGPGSGWQADRLEASVLVDGTVVARYRLETAWAEECSGTGDTASCIEERVQNSVERPQASGGANGTEDTEGTEDADGN
ncbi:hypothetical protein HWV07_04230 [Natronomonas salina]|uniref:hypothetical protein n=1 Tax=Natronomonas salina TaxID=1710540 RepID=UPI0015B48128|nr:hypothetical protein [Natronomonas salina]QLD88282.1 hypothetical protein HWV07_04230 [Natronomonas salina]